jgi:predicted nuclease with TOPRIM domain
VEDAYGQSSKWKWSFVEIKGRYAAVAKNLIDFKNIISKLDPRIEGYRERVEHIELAKSLLSNAADSHREKYELSTQRIDDMHLAINYLSALKRIHILLNEAEKAEITKKKIEIWTNKMEGDIKKKKERI